MKQNVVKLAVLYDSKSPFTSQKKYNFERPVLWLPPFFFFQIYIFIKYVSQMFCEL